MHLIAFTGLAVEIHRLRFVFVEAKTQSLRFFCCRLKKKKCPEMMGLGLLVGLDFFM